MKGSPAFAAAVRAGRAVVAAETVDPGVRPSSRSLLLSHGSRTSRSVLMLHGYTRDPEQMAALGRDFHARGYNVWIPRAPGHGTTDPLIHHGITAPELTSHAAGALEIAAGLGDEVGIVGISAGAVLATWLASQPDDVVRRLLLLSPFFGPSSRQVPAVLVRPLIYLYGRGLVPDRVTSRGYSLATVSRYLGIARHLPASPRRTGLRSIAVAVSALDDVVDTTAAAAIPRRIAEANGLPLRTCTLPGSLGIGHDTLALDQRPDGRALRERYIGLYEDRG